MTQHIMLLGSSFTLGLAIGLLIAWRIQLSCNNRVGQMLYRMRAINERLDGEFDG